MAAASVQVRPTTSTGPTSPIKQCLSQAYYATPNLYNGSDRGSKRSCEPAKTKRNMMHSPAQRQSYNRSPALDRMVTGKNSTRQSPTQVPSGSTEFTTTRRNPPGFGAGGLHQNLQQQPHSNSPPKTGSPKKTARYGLRICL